MKQTRLLMGMPISIEIIDKSVDEKIFDVVYDYFKYIDNKFSVYKNDSEISQINQNKILEKDYSKDMKQVLKFCEQTRKQTNGFFNIQKDIGIDPSGLVKGWAIFNGAKLLKKNGFENFYIEAGGDIQVSGKNLDKENWRIGIRNPFKEFKENEIVKVISVFNKGVATSGTYLRGAHIYNPKDRNKKVDEIVSLTVIGSNIYEADRFATAAFAMGQKAILFVEGLNGFEGYQIDKNGIATFTSGFNKFILENEKN